MLKFVNTSEVYKVKPRNSPKAYRPNNFDLFSTELCQRLDRSLCPCLEKVACFIGHLYVEVAEDPLKGPQIVACLREDKVLAYVLAIDDILLLNAVGVEVGLPYR